MTQVAGVILAGGQARRMGGGDKCLLPLAGGRVVLEEIIARLAGQVGCLALNANGDAARFARFGLPVVADQVADAGPLAGVLAGMGWARAQGCDRLVTVAGDTPFLPADLVARLAAGGGGAPVSVAATDRVHPVFALWDVARADDLRAALAAGTRRVMDFAAAQGAVEVVFPVLGGGDPFFNINTPEDLVRAQARAIAGGGM
ncbi:MAG: molybdenum cofactor guanylyltransferase MobA [Paracoccaceae bacterium]